MPTRRFRAGLSYPVPAALGRWRLFQSGFSNGSVIPITPVGSKCRLRRPFVLKTQWTNRLGNLWAMKVSSLKGLADASEISQVNAKRERELGPLLPRRAFTGRG